MSPAVFVSTGSKRRRIYTEWFNGNSNSNHCQCTVGLFSTFSWWVATSITSEWVELWKFHSHVLLLPGGKVA